MQCLVGVLVPCFVVIQLFAILRREKEKPMNLKFVIFVLVLILIPFVAQAADDGRGAVSFAYDVDFEMYFDNREASRSHFSKSSTLFGARLTPSIGLDMRQKGGMQHRVMLGVDVMREFASGDKYKLLNDVSLWYRMKKTVKKTDITLTAGIFPRNFTEGDWPLSFFSDSLKFYDNNLEGLLVQFHRPAAYFELGCDWLGMYGDESRERFMIFASGQGRLKPFFTLGYHAYLYHFSCSRKASGVVDNILLNPYAKFDLGPVLPLEELSISLNWIQGAQNDRKFIGKYVFPAGFQIDTDIRKWGAGIRNRFFYGTDMMPYYNSIDASGSKYGNLLYMGDPFYRIHDDGSSGWGPYDRLEAYWEPKIGPYLNIRIAAVFHFHKKYSGCQQMVTLKFNLDKLLKRKSSKS